VEVLLPAPSKIDTMAKSHPSTRLFGLRSIENNYVSDGTGRDWTMFGDPGFREGRRTPVAPDPMIAYQGERRTELSGALKSRARMLDGRKRQPREDGMRGDGKSKVRPDVMQRWQRAASSPCILDTLAPRRKSMSQNEPVSDTACQLGDPIGKFGENFKPNLATCEFRCPTFPVDKHHYFSQQAVMHQKLPCNGSRGTPEMGLHQASLRVPAGCTPLQDGGAQLHRPIINKYHWFGDQHVGDSPHFQTTDPSDGLAGPRRQLNCPGSLSRSLAALPIREPEPGGAPFPFGHPRM